MCVKDAFGSDNVFHVLFGPKSLDKLLATLVNLLNLRLSYDIFMISLKLVVVKFHLKKKKKLIIIRMKKKNSSVFLALP